MFCRDGKDFIEAKTVEIGDIRLLLERVDLVDDQEKWLMTFAEQPSELLIRHGDTGTSVEDKKDERGFLNRDLGLFEDALWNLAFLTWHESTRVYHLKGTTVPRRNTIYAIPCNPGLVGNNRAALADQSIE